jgi:hypothetical protein
MQITFLKWKLYNRILTTVIDVVVELTNMEAPQIDNYFANSYCRSKHNNVSQYLFKI